MTREEAIKQLKSLLAHCERMWSKDDSIFGSDCEALKIALSALRPVTREQVEKAWRGEWEWKGPCRDAQGRSWATCKRCGTRQRLADHASFCPACGAPMTDEAVDMVMQRLEALHENR